MSTPLISCRRPNNGKAPRARGDVFMINEVPYVVLKVQGILDEPEVIILIAGKLDVSTEEIFSLIG